MGIKDFVIDKILGRFHLTQAKTLLEHVAKLGQPSEHAIPADLVGMLAREAARGVMNTQFFQSNRDWIFPYWAERQYDPTDRAFVPRIMAVGLNCTHRNWVGIGTTDGKIEPVVDPRGLVTPWLDGWSLDTWVEGPRETIYPSRANTVRQSTIDAAPMIRTLISGDSLLLELETFATRLRGIDEVVLHRARVQNLSDTPQDVRLRFAVRPYNPEGVALVHAIRYLPEGYLIVNDRIAVVTTTEPDRIVCSDLRIGDCAQLADKPDARTEVRCDSGLASAFLEYALSIPPGSVAHRNVVMPVDGAPRSMRVVSEVRRFDYRDQRTRAKSRWHEIADEGMNVELPDERVAQSFVLNKSYLRLLDDGETINPGPLTYHHFWFRDSAFLVAALDKMGYTASARRKLIDYPSKQKSDGFYLSQEGEWDSNGQAIWTLVEHARMTGDHDFLRAMFDSIRQAAYWIENKRQTTKSDTPHSSLLPPGPSAEHLGPNDYFYWDDWWGLAGLRDATWAAELLGERTPWLDFEKYEQSFREDIMKSLRHVETRLGRPILTASPYRRFDSGAIGSIACVYPLRLMDPRSAIVENTLTELREKCFVNGGFFQDMVHAGVNVYLTLHVAQMHLSRREAAAWTLAQNLLDRATQVGTWPEAIHPQTGGGCMGDGHHGWAVADWLLFVRNALLVEEGDVLAITPVVPSEWLSWGKRIGVTNAPTHFGTVSYEIEGMRGEIVLTMKPSYRTAPRLLTWTLPFDIREALVDDRAMTINGRVVAVPAGTTRIRVPRP
ncbi:MAG: hypothetical protein IT350_13970 [Deltaproteobacteria bacterium]|nr:hypothetical protein [Deltaproteobacteria bacterium]